MAPVNLLSRALAGALIFILIEPTVQQFPSLFGGNGYGSPFGNGFNNPFQPSYPGQGGYPGNPGYGNQYGSNYNQRPLYSNYQPGVGNQYAPTNSAQPGVTNPQPQTGSQGAPSYGQQNPAYNSQYPYNNQYPGSGQYPNSGYNSYPGTNNGVNGLPPNANRGVPNQYGNRPGQYGASPSSVPVDQATSNGYRDRPSNQQYGNGQGRVPTPQQQQPNNANNYNRSPNANAPQGNFDNGQYDANKYGGAGGANKAGPLIDVRQGPGVANPSAASTPAAGAQKTNTPAWSFFEPENSNVKN